MAGHRLQPTPVFETYWRFAAARQEVYQARLRGDPRPWTTDPIMASYRFTNCYRASDRVSQYLINRVIYRGSRDPDEVLFRILLFRFFNRVSTWELLQAAFGDLAGGTFRLDRYDEVLNERLLAASESTRPPMSSLPRRWAPSGSTRIICCCCRGCCATGCVPNSRQVRLWRKDSGPYAYPGIGDFLAFQLIIDINYSILINFDEMDFVVPGPGANDGICKCFGPSSRGIEAEIIRYMSDSQSEHFGRLGLGFPGLNGRRLQLIDCQNLFCEVDKYARLAYPEITGYSGRTRIKQRYAPTDQAVTSWFPPKWGINGSRTRIPAAADHY